VSRVLLDSTVLVDLLRGRKGTRDQLEALQAEGGVPFVCAISAFEISAGFKAREREAAGALFEGLGVAPLGIAEGRLAGWWHSRFAARGRTLSRADCLIAAAAVGIGARLATANVKDFPMKEVSVEFWPSS
jgi:hypothetical protein